MPGDDVESGRGAMTEVPPKKFCPHNMLRWPPRSIQVRVQSMMLQTLPETQYFPTGAWLCQCFPIGAWLCVRVCCLTPTIDLRDGSADQNVDAYTQKLLDSGFRLGGWVSE